MCIRDRFYTNDVDENGNYIKEITENNKDAKAIPLKKHAEPNVTGDVYKRQQKETFETVTVRCSFYCTSADIGFCTSGYFCTPSEGGNSILTGGRIRIPSMVI